MIIILKPKQDEIDFPVSMFDIDLNYTVDHVITLLTLKFKAFDANELVIYFNGRRLPFELEVLKAGIYENAQLEVGVEKKGFCKVF
jgi:hypothetical protein